MTFVVRGLDPAPFRPLFALADEALAAQGIRRVRADRPDAYPCRVSLRRVEEGEDLLLLNHAHRTAAHSPYRASGPIFVGRSATEAATFAGALPPMLQDRLLSLRAYDADALIVDAEVAEGPAVEAVLERFLADPQVAAVDLHFARRGCFAARVERAG
ncbi:MAG TPA: DUF1203 domain-containing protein [Microvirga sp.]|jgi:hypothetical protein|nr:DUF1203 domain-containing protein [Microvirga sp.]